MNDQRRQRRAQGHVYTRRLVLSILSIVALGVVRPRIGQEEPRIAREYTLKAAFIFNFARYISWPKKAFSTAESPFVIGVLGGSPPELKRALAHFEKKKVGTRAIRIQYLTEPADAKNCHIVFFRNTLDADTMKETVEHCVDTSVLLVGEAEDFIDNGGVVNFSPAGKKLVIELARDRALKCRLTVDARLLRLAKIVD